MVPRLRRDISWPDLAAGAFACVAAWDPQARSARLEAEFGGRGDALVAYSVRSALDAYLSEVDWAPGSEVLVSALTIPHMTQIIRDHGFVVVPVDLDPHTLVPAASNLRRAMSSRSVAWLHAHLFGTRSDLTELADMCQERGLVVMEDCAQAYTGADYVGADTSDVCLFSFGTIKTATALGGAIVRIVDPHVRQRVRTRMDGWPRERRRRRIAKTCKYGVLHALARPLPYGVLCRAIERSGRDADAWVHAAVRGFPGSDLARAIRHRPSAPLLALMERRLGQDTASRVDRRAGVGEAVVARLPAPVRPLGAGAPLRTHWVVPVVSDDPAALRAHLRSAGFDASTLSSLTVVHGPAHGSEEMARWVLDRLVYVPATQRHTDRLIGHIASAVDLPRSGRV